MKMKITMLFLIEVIICFSLLRIVLANQYTTFSKLQLPPNVTGPESAAFDGLGQGPYVTVMDGRILKWQGPIIGFVDFAYTSPQRTRQLCDGTTDPQLGPTCGRPLALSFNYLTGLLYIADAYLGLLVVGPIGGLATQLSSGYKFLQGIDVDSVSGNVYFTDASLTYYLRNITQPGFVPDSAGRLLKYDPAFKNITVILSGLSGGGGPAVSSDRTYILVPEYVNMRILKYWLEGPKANTSEPFLTEAGSPNKIKRAANLGEFWVAVEIRNQQPAPVTLPQGIRVNGSGTVLQTVSFSTAYFNTTVRVVQEQNGALSVGSSHANFVGAFTN